MCGRLETNEIIHDITFTTPSFVFPEPPGQKGIPYFVILGIKVLQIFILAGPNAIVAHC